LEENSRQNNNKRKNSGDDCWDKSCDEKKGVEEEPKLLGPFNRKQLRFSIILVVIGIVLMIVVSNFIPRADVTVVEYSEFKELIRGGEINRVEIAENEYTGFNLTREQAEQLAEQQAENQATIHHAWRVHFENIRHSLAHGFYQG
jgi:hypothetical protein